MRRILVVDDHDDARELLALVVGSNGYTVATAANGREALDEARRHRPDVIVMDLFMPEMDGYEASLALKADPELSSVPIIAYTAKTGRPEMATSPFAAFCLKPCLPTDLLAIIAKVLAAHPPAAI